MAETILLLVAIGMAAGAHAQNREAFTEHSQPPHRAATSKGRICTLQSGVRVGFVANELNAAGVPWSGMDNCDVLVFPPVRKPSASEISAIRTMLDAEKKVVLDAYADSVPERARIQSLSRDLVGATLDSDAVVISQSPVGRSVMLTPLYKDSTIQKNLPPPGAINDDIVNNNPRNYFNLIPLR